MSIQNLNAAIDPFIDDVEASALKTSQDFVHIRIQQRTGRKSLTTVQGLSVDLDLKKILRAFKKDFFCNGTIVKDEALGNVIQLQGDHRRGCAQFLVNEGITDQSLIKIHGF